MRHAIRLILSGLVATQATATSRAQNHESGRRVGLAIVGSTPYGGYPTYHPGQLGVLVPYLGGAPVGPFVGAFPADQAGPGGLMLPHMLATSPRPPAVPASLRRVDPARATELTEVGDRSFRGGNYRRAEERYHLAARANPDSPTPHIHLAQVAIVRGDYNLAAGHFRTAVATTPGAGWLLEAGDIQAMYGEPEDFRKRIARLESFLQTHPDHRNAWFVLGAEQFFSGHPRVAVDAFLRLRDRPADEALAAFTDAATVASRSSSHQ